MLWGKALDLMLGCWSFWLFCCCFSLAPAAHVTSCSSLIESWSRKESVLAHCTAIAQWKKQFAGAKKISFIFSTWDLIGLPCFLLIQSLQLHFFPALCIMTHRKIPGLVLSVVTGELFQEIFVHPLYQPWPSHPDKEKRMWTRKPCLVLVMLPAPWSNSNWQMLKQPASAYKILALYCIYSTTHCVASCIWLVCRPLQLLPQFRSSYLEN